MIFNFKNTEISVSFSFFALIAFFVITDKIGAIPIFLFSVLLHELTHLLVMWLLGSGAKEINLSVMGADIKPRCLPSPMGQFFIHLSAPLFNLLLFLIFKDKFPLFSAVNFLIAFINLLPIGSLDGGNCINVIINKLCDYDEKFKAKRIANLIFGSILSSFFLYMTFKYHLNPLFTSAIILMSFDNEI